MIIIHYFSFISLWITAWCLQSEAFPDFCVSLALTGASLVLSSQYQVSIKYETSENSHCQTANIWTQFKHSSPVSQLTEDVFSSCKLYKSSLKENEKAFGQIQDDQRKFKIIIRGDCWTLRKVPFMNKV